MSVYTLWLAVAGALTAGSLLSRIVRDGLEARELIERVPPVQIGDGAAGWVRVSGRVRAVTETLPAPLSGREAVLFELRVGNVASPGVAPHRRRRRIAAVAFEIDDGTGRALVRLSAVGRDTGEDGPEILTAVPASKVTRHWGLFGPPPDVQRLLKQFSLEDWGELPFIVAERIIAPGDELTVAGYATREPSPAGTTASFRSIPTLMVFEATPEHAIALASPRALASWWGA